MITRELLEYITNVNSRGVSLESIKEALRAQGWKEEDITEGITNVTNGISVSAPSAVSLENSPLPGVFALMQEAWELMSSHIWTLIGILFFPMLGVLGTLFLVGITAGVSSAMTYVPLEAIGLLVVALFLGTVFIFVWAKIALVYAIIHVKEKKRWLKQLKKLMEKILDGVDFMAMWSI